MLHCLAEVLHELADILTKAMPLVHGFPFHGILKPFLSYDCFCFKVPNGYCGV